MPYVRQTQALQVVADVRAAVDYLRKDAPDRPVFTVGFCYGGAHSWLQAAAGHGLAGAIGFYAGRATRCRRARRHRSTASRTSPVPSSD